MLGKTLPDHNALSNYSVAEARGFAAGYELAIEHFTNEFAHELRALAEARLAALMQQNFPPRRRRRPGVHQD